MHTNMEKEKLRQKNALQKTKYKYSFSADDGEDTITIQRGQPMVVYCKSAFDYYITSKAELDEALSIDGHHPVSGGYNIGKLSPTEDILVCIDNILTYYDRVWCITKSAGALKNEFRNCERSAEARKAHLYRDNDSITESPMIGIIGTRTKTGTMGSGRGGQHGGNIDLPCLKSNSCVILPANNCMSDVWIGDIHAKQGYGELAGVAVECSGEVNIRIYPVKLLHKTKEPIIINKIRENEYNIYFVGCRNTFSNAVKAAVRNAVRYESVLGATTRVEAYEKLGIEGNLVVGQAIGKTVSVAIEIKCNNLNVLVREMNGGIL